MSSFDSSWESHSISEQQNQIAKILEQIAIRESADADQLLAALRDEGVQKLA